MKPQTLLLSEFVKTYTGECPIRLRIHSLQSEGSRESIQDALAGRLLDFGFRSNETIEWVGRAPFKGPFIFSVRGALVALRQEELARVLIEDRDLSQNTETNPMASSVPSRSQVSGV